jgi:outer membrane protein assembly factor BamB
MMIQPFISILSLLLSLVSLADADTQSEWAQWMGPQRNGISPETEWSSEWTPEGPKVLWKASVGIGFSPISEKGGCAYTLGHTEGIDTIYCFKSENGEILWKHSYPCKIHNYLHEGGPASAPLLDGTAVYTFSRGADLLCLNAIKGQVLWGHQLATEYKVKVPLCGFTSSPLIYQNQLIVDAGITFAFEKTTGKVVWQTEKYVESYSSPQLFTYQTQPALALFNGFGIIILEAVNGNKLWSLPWKTPKYDTNTSTPLIQGDKIYFSSGYDRGCALATLGAASEAAVVWQNKKAQSSYNTPLLWKDHLYGFDKSDLQCVEFQTGKVLWSQDMENNGCQILADGKLIVQVADGALVIVEASPQAYQELARAHPLQGRCWTLPTLCKGRLYCRNSQGEVVCLDVRK